MLRKVEEERAGVYVEEEKERRKQTRVRQNRRDGKAWQKVVLCRKERCRIIRRSKAKRDSVRKYKGEECCVVCSNWKRRKLQKMTS